MPEIKSLQEFYDPTKAMNLQLGLQQLALQNQQFGLHQQQIEQQGRNLEIDNLQKALQTADPMQSYPIQKQLNDKLGLPTPPVNDYYANLPYTRRLRGAKNLSEQAGIKTDEDTAAFVEASGPLQTQIGNAIALSPLEKAKTAALEREQADHNDLVTNVNTQLNTLIPLTASAKLSLERSAPQVAALADIQQEYDKNVKSLGITKAAQIRKEKILLNPELQQFSDRRIESLPKIQQQVQQLEDQHAQLQARAEMIARGVTPLKEGESIHLLAGQVDASLQQLAYAKATLAFAKDPSPANHEALKTIQATMAAQIEQLNQRKNASQGALSIRRDAQQETARKNQYAEQQDKNMALGQSQLLEAVGKGENMDRAAARIGKALQVAPADLKKALASPDKPLAQVDVKVGEGLAKEIGPMMSESRAAALGAVDTVDTVQRAQAAIAKGLVNVGPTATIRQKVGQVAQLLGVGGTETEEQLVNTRNLIRSLGQFSLAARKQLKGQGQVSDFEGKLLIKAESGEIEDMTIPELKSFLNVTDRLARKQHSLHQQNLKTMRANPKLAEVAPFYDVPDLPSASSKSTPTVNDYDSLPSGAVYQAPDGTMRRKK